MSEKLPSWLVWSEDMGEILDSADTVSARDAVTAAQTYAERSYRDESWEGEMEVSVRPVKGGEVLAFAVEPVQTLSFDIRPLRAHA